MTIREWQTESGQVAREKGFKADVDIHRSLLLIVGELTEAQNELRNGREPQTLYLTRDEVGGPSKPEGFPIELADVALRLLNLADDLGIDLQQAMELKHNYNKTRPAMHGGKKF